MTPIKRHLPPTLLPTGAAFIAALFALLMFLLVGLPTTALAQSPGADATLSGLTVSPRNIIGFTAERTTYEVGVASTVTQATITATASDPGATVAYSGTDIDSNTPGLQVDLWRAGRNVVRVTVTAPDGATTLDYTVSVNRGVTDAKGWQAGADLDGLIAAGNASPEGIWSDGTTMWVADSTDAKIYAYRMSDGTGDSAKDFDTLVAAGNTFPGGIWSDDTTMWVVDITDAKIYAYRMSDKARDSAKDFDTLVAAGNYWPGGIWSDGTTMWVADPIHNKIFAYRMSDKARDSAKDFDTLDAAGNPGAYGIWSNGTTMWVSDYFFYKLYAYRMSTKARDSAKDFDTLDAAGNQDPYGIWSNGTTMWVTEYFDDKVYSYNMPPLSMETRLRSLTLSGVELTTDFDSDTLAYAGNVMEGVTATTVEPETLDHNAAAVVRLNGVVDRDGTVTLPAPNNRQSIALPNEITVEVTAEDGTTMRTYTVTLIDYLKQTTDRLRPVACSRGEVPADTSTTALIVVPEIIRHGAGRCYGEIDTPGDEDWVGVDLKRGKNYQIDVLGAGNAWTEVEGGDPLTLRGPAIWSFYHEDDLDQRLAPTEPSFGTGSQHRFLFSTGPKSGRFYIEVQASAHVSVGTYAVQVFDLSAPIGNTSHQEQTGEQQQMGLPERPQGLTGIVAHDSVSLTWDDPEDASITGYQILRRNRAVHAPWQFQVHVDDTGSILRRNRAVHAPGQFQVHVDDTSSADAFYVDQDVEPETRYVYRIKARSAAGLSKRSKYFNADTPAAPDPALNNPATGAPTIIGTARVGETLTAETSGIEDADGLDNASFSYQWTISLGAASADIPGATEAAYTPTASDAGVAIQVRVSFTDDAGNEETLTSAATAAVTEEPPAQPQGLTGTVEHDVVSLTWDDPEKASITGYQILRLDRKVHGLGNFQVHVDDTGTADTLYVDTDVAPETRYVYRIKARNGAGLSKRSFYFNADTPAAPDPALNNPATGAPAITGTAQVGETLTADVSGIADPDGLTNALYSYQWIANNGTSDTDITGATDSTHTLVAADEGKTVKVRVSFTDDADNEETLTSAATAATAAPEPEEPPSPPTKLRAAVNGDGTVTLTWDDPDDDSITGYQVLRRNRDRTQADEFTVINEDTGTAATTYLDDAVEPETRYLYRIHAINAGGMSDLSHWSTVRTPVAPEPEENSPATGEPTISGTAQVGETLTADTSSIADPDGLTNALYSYQWIANNGTSDTDITGATDSTHTLVAADEGKTVKVRVSFTDDADNEETLTSAATAATAAPAPEENSPATGEPTKGGTAQVGETLTADVSGIADPDGLTNALYSYQWIANNGTSDTDITGATGSTYTLVAADEGKTVKVRVSFTDDADNEETLTSDATAAVASRPNRPATGAPAIGGTAQVGETLTTDTSGIADADGLDNVTFIYQWIANDSEIQGEVASAYTLADADEGKTVKVRVRFTDDAGNEETLTSAATAAVMAAEPEEPQEPPAQPQGLSGTASHDEVSLSWNDPEDDSITGYQILRRNPAVDAPGQFQVHVEDTGSAATTYVDREVEPDTRYVYRIKARSAAGLSERSDYFKADTPPEPEPEPEPNSPATGLPVILGTARVGETLTADISGIADADGLDNATFSYQWIVSDGGAGLDIPGATGAAYTLIPIDAGLVVMVRVSFTDDAGNEETLTSAATAVVAEEQ